jgi:hypothetical protein
MLAQASVYSTASQLLSSLLNIDLCAAQFHRVATYYGEQIDPILEANHTEYIPQLQPSKAPDDITYVMVDGSMVLTRKDKWKEIKLARLFKASQNIEIQPNRKEVMSNVYVSHLGSVNKFLPKVERHLSLIDTSKKVFIADGAAWIWKWVEDNYPGSTQILDYYHAVEKIGEVARHQYKNIKARKKWLDEQKELLMEDKVYEVIGNMKKMRVTNNQAREARQQAMRYYETHEDRMLYKTYKERGLLIGSGPIESAHRNVIQQRAKLSGQRWSIEGLQAVINLRCYNQSNSWKLIDNLIKLAA